MNTYKFDDKRFNFSGRIDLQDPACPRFTWPGSLVNFKFKGTSLSLKLINQNFWRGKFLGVVVDGNELCVNIDTDNNVKEQTVTLCDGLSDSEHNVYIYKRMEGHYITLCELYVEGELLEPNPKPKLKIEVYGDSVSAGSVVDCVDYVGKHDPENDGSYDNAWHAYPLLLSQMMPADVYVTSQGGIAIFDKTGYFEMPDMRGMESCYDKVCYCKNYPLTEWDFSFKPDVIIFAIGQNDSGPNPDCLKDPDYYKRWTDKYIEIAQNARSHSPNAKVIFALTVLCHDKIWDDAIEDIKNRMGAEENGVYHFMYSRCGKATPGHPRTPEQIEMATEMKAFIESLEI